MEKMLIWNAVKRPPETALKQIFGGRLKGMTDINPQWRYQAMTEQFGPIGIGWKYQVNKLWNEAIETTGEVFSFADVSLFFHIDNAWSEPIQGIGGSALVSREKTGLHASDEAYKMAITDALSVCMKMIGIGADIYAGRWDGSKYKDEEPQAGSWNSLDEPTKEWMLYLAMEVTQMLIENDAEGASLHIDAQNMDADFAVAFNTRLDSKQRSTIKAYKAIARASTLDELKKAWEEAPKHAHPALSKAKDAKKAMLDEPTEEFNE